MCEDNTAEVIRLARLGLLPEFITNFHGITNFLTIWLVWILLLFCL